MLTGNVEFCLLKESVYAGGAGSTARSMTKLENSTPNILDLPLPKSGSSIKMPLNLYSREQIGGSGVSGIRRFRIVKEIEQKKGEIDCYIQSNRFFNWVLGTLGVSDPDQSFTIHWQTPDYRFEAYGCVIEELVLTIPEKELPTHKITFGAYNFKTETDVDQLTVVGVDETQPLLRKDVQVTINSSSVLFAELNLTIKNEVEIVQGSNGFEQILKARELSGDFTLPIEDTTYNSALLSKTITKRSISIILGTICTITISDCEFVVEEVDEASKMEPDLIKRTVKFYPTETSNITVV